MSRWFRFYDDVINDPKVLSLPEAMRWHWVAVLCIASKHGGELPSIDHLTIMLRMGKHKVAALLTSLHGAVLLDKTETSFRPHNWDGRQYKSDVSTERVKRFRERERNVSETPPDTDTEAEKKERAPELRSGGTRKRGTRLPDDFQLTEADIEFAAEHGFAGDPLQAVFSDFGDYWRARAGPQGVKLDWPATWRRWIRTEADKRKNQGPRHANIGRGDDRSNGLRGVIQRLRSEEVGGDAPGRPPPRLLSHG